MGNPTVHVVPAGEPVKMGFGKRAAFPRSGAWAIHIPTSQLGIVFKVNDTEINFHYQDAKGQSVLHVEKTLDKEGNEHERLTANNIVSRDEVRAATYAEIVAGTPAERISVFTAFDAALMGYEVDDTSIQSMTALQRRTLGLKLSAQDEATAKVEEAEMQLEILKRQRVATHPEAIALEEQIEAERVTFIESVEKRRQDMFSKLSTELTKDGK